MEKKEKSRKTAISSQRLFVGYIFGYVIGQCKNCYYFGVVKDAKTITYRGKDKNCHNLSDIGWGVISNCNEADFGCILWKPRKKSNKKVVVKIKI